MKEFDMLLWDVLVTIFWFMLLLTWAFLLVTIFGDLLRDHGLSGWDKALWTLFLVITPLLGVLVYLIARGPSINERNRAEVKPDKEGLGRHVRATTGAGSVSTADELGKLAVLRDRGTISDEEFQHAKARALGRPSGPAAGAVLGDGVVPSTTL
jgi:hypothetical protein